MADFWKRWTAIFCVCSEGHPVQGDASQVQQKEKLVEEEKRAEGAYMYFDEQGPDTPAKDSKKEEIDDLPPQTQDELNELATEQGMQQHRKSLRQNGFRALSMVESFGLFDVNLLEEPDWQDNVERYYNLCKSTDLMVTLSCFSLWFDNAKKNKFAKVIPCAACMNTSAALEQDGKKIRVFFFDDNIDMDNCDAEGAGICNLRNIANGEHVNFSQGVNGFRREREGRHTLVHASTDYQVVLVQANILDAMEDPAYFSKILQKYAAPDEKLLVYMDVNSTIVCVDTVTEKSSNEILLGTMFEFVEVNPKQPFEFTWEDRKPIKIAKAMNFKAILKKIAKDDPEYYQSFYKHSRCERFFNEMRNHGDVKWSTQDATLTVDEFNRTYDEYRITMQDAATDMGITKSWLRCWEYLRDNNHATCINSFGVDAWKVLSEMVEDENSVMHVTVNFNSWSDKDKSKFEEAYGVSIRQGSMRSSNVHTARQMNALLNRSDERS